MWAAVPRRVQPPPQRTGNAFGEDVGSGRGLAVRLFADGPGVSAGNAGRRTVTWENDTLSIARAWGATISGSHSSIRHLTGAGPFRSTQSDDALAGPGVRNRSERS